MPNMMSLSLTFQTLWPMSECVFCHGVTDLQAEKVKDRQTGQKLDAPEFSSGGIKVIPTGN